MTHERQILLVDDSQNDLFLMHAAFKKAEFNNPLQEVHNGEKAIAYLEGRGLYSDRARFPLPSVLLLDLNMPQKNGFEVLAWVRSQPALKRLVIIILTASTRIEDVERAYDLGANWYLVKPATMAEFVVMIRCLRDWIQVNTFPLLNEAKQREPGFRT